MDAVITSGVRIFIKILPLPQAYVHFCHFTNGDYCVTIPYILISFVRQNRSKAALYSRVNPVLIKPGRAKQQHDRLGWLNDSFVVLIWLLFKLLSDTAQLTCIYTRESV